jgi:hypothetical protein
MLKSEKYFPYEVIAHKRCHGSCLRCLHFQEGVNHKAGRHLAPVGLLGGRLTVRLCDYPLIP